MSIATFYNPELRLTYTGAELRPHFLLTRLKIEGSAVAAFRGSCRVETQHLVDWEDRLNSDRIEAAEMLHVIAEIFPLELGGGGIREGVLAQRMLMALANERLQALKPSLAVHREGDDLFAGGRKLSVSIATVSPLSVLIHSALNIDPAGAPVPAIGLTELGIDPDRFAREWLDAFTREWTGLSQACSKVRPVV